MKKITLHTIALFLMSAITQAQPTLNRNEMLPIGSVMVEKYTTDFSILDTSIQGSGVIWDFSKLKNNSSIPDLVVNIVNPASTPYSANFTNSNYAYKEVSGGITKYRYFNLTNTEMERVGSYSFNLNIYSDPQMEYIFPLTLGAINEDTWANTNSSTGGTYDIECVGDGKLILPSGTYNAIMVKAHITEFFLDIYTYFWYSSDNGAILTEYIVGDGIFTADTGFYLDSVTLDVPINNFVTDFNYNNPITNDFTLNFQSLNSDKYSYTVFNSIGLKVLQGGYITSNEGTTESLKVDFSTFQSGVYYFTLKSEEKGQNVKTIKLIKQ